MIKCKNWFAKDLARLVYINKFMASLIWLYNLIQNIQTLMKDLAKTYKV